MMKPRIALLIGVACAAVLAPALLTRSAFAQDENACVALSEQALTQVNEQKLLDARVTLARCGVPACPDIVRASCQRRLGEVNQAIPSMVFETKDGAGEDVPGVTITVDGRPLTDHREGAPVAIDPGTHQLHFEVAGHPGLDKRFVLRQGERDRHERIVFESPQVSEPPKREKPAARYWTPLRISGVAAGVTGVAGIAIGSVFGVMATADKKDLVCNASGGCRSAGLDPANTHANISTAGFVVGGVLLAGGVALVLFAPKGEAGSVQLGPAVSENSAGFVARGAF